MGTFLDHVLAVLRVCMRIWNGYLPTIKKLWEPPPEPKPHRDWDPKEFTTLHKKDKRKHKKMRGIQVSQHSC